MQVLIIEDELPAARQLMRLLQAQQPNIKVLDTLDSVEAAVTWLNTFKAPDLIFMDIQIADGLSFNIFARVNIQSPVIFTTAFDQYALQAFRVNAVDYLLKPIDPDELRTALAKASRQELATAGNLQSLARYFGPQPYKDRFLIKTGQQMTLLKVEEIAFFRSESSLTQAHTFDGKRHFIEQSLDELEQVLNPRHYHRVSRSMMVHLDSISKVQPHFNGRLKLSLSPSPPDDVFVSRDRVAGFKVWLGG